MNENLVQETSEVVSTPNFTGWERMLIFNPLPCFSVDFVSFFYPTSSLIKMDISTTLEWMGLLLLDSPELFYNNARITDSVKQNTFHEDY